MSKRFEWTFYQTMYTNGQAHETHNSQENWKYSKITITS